MNHIIQKEVITKIIDRLIDLSLLLLSAYLAIIFEGYLHNFIWAPEKSLKLFVLPLIILIWLVLISIYEQGRLYRNTSYKDIILNVFKINLIGLSILVFMAFFTKIELFFRSTIFFFGVSSLLLLISKRIFLKYILNNIRRNGIDYKNIMIIGIGDKTDKLIEQIDINKEFGLKVSLIGNYNNSNIPNGKYSEFSIISRHNIVSSLFENSIDEVFITEQGNVEEIVIAIHSVGVNCHVVADVLSLFPQIKNIRHKPVLREYYNMQLLSFGAIKTDLYLLYIKNFIERLSSILLFVLFLPIMIIFGLFIKASSPGPILFSQTRVGLRGRRFKQYKLRTMFNDAESRLDEYLHLNEQQGPAFKIKNDPRITEVGKLLRKYSIDELPQLINVLKGDMNLIGPRPPLPSELTDYKIEHYRRLSIKPGITGLWQTSGRNKLVKFDDWVKLDLEYIDNWSFKNDILIAFKTIYVIMKGTGT